MLVNKYVLIYMLVNMLQFYSVVVKWLSEKILWHICRIYATLSTDNSMYKWTFDRICNLLEIIRNLLELLYKF